VENKMSYFFDIKRPNAWKIIRLMAVIFLLLSSNSYATYPPSFSDCLYGDGDEYDQLEACQQLIRSNPKNRSLHKALGKTLLERKKYSKALLAYKRALSIFPNDKAFMKSVADIVKKLPKKEQQYVKKQIKKEVKKAVVAKRKSVEKKKYKVAVAKKAKSSAKVVIKKPTATKVTKKAVLKTKVVKATPKVKMIAKVETVKTRRKAEPAPKAKAKPKKQAKVAALSPQQQKFVEQLNLLKSLKEQHIISQAEYDQRKKSLLDSTFNISSVGSSNTKKASAKGSENIDNLKFGNYYALIIGNNKYQHLKGLETAVNDAETLAALLKEHYGFKVKLLLNANRYDTLKAMGEFRNTLKKDDNLLIYYAGHGVLDKASERGYWLPVDAELDYTSNWISTADITDTLKALQSWHVLVVADSCYSGTLVRSISVQLQNPEEENTLMKRLLEKKSRTVITSGGLEPVVDSGANNHSVFAAALIDVLKDTDKVIEAEKVFSQIRDKVILNADQTPEYSNVRKVGHNGGDFIFLRH
jgi:tetratricopeptide (TPR) repeat protein